MAEERLVCGAQNVQGGKYIKLNKGDIMKLIYLIIILALVPVAWAKTNYTRIATTDSMVPYIEPGDMVILQTITSDDNITEGNVYCFRPIKTDGFGVESKAIYCHRLISIAYYYKGYYNWSQNIPFKVEYNFKGDNSKTYDRPVPRRNIGYMVVGVKRRR